MKIDLQLIESLSSSEFREVLANLPNPSHFQKILVETLKAEESKNMQIVLNRRLLDAFKAGISNSIKKGN